MFLGELSMAFQLFSQVTLNLADALILPECFGLSV